MDALIRRNSTGNAERFASLIGISVSQLKENLNEMRELGAPIEFSRSRGTYYYTRECKLLFAFSDAKLSEMQQRAIKGGMSVYFLFRPVWPDDEYRNLGCNKIVRGS
jgi:hypothetical protein